jgi:hypothetical protein
MKEESTNLGFTSSDGNFQSISLLTSQNLEFASKTLVELEILIKEYERSEKYEKCAIIRDELIRRKE